MIVMMVGVDVQHEGGEVEHGGDGEDSVGRGTEIMVST